MVGPFLALGAYTAGEVNPRLLGRTFFHARLRSISKTHKPDSHWGNPTKVNSRCSESDDHCT